MRPHRPSASEPPLRGAPAARRVRHAVPGRRAHPAAAARARGPVRRARTAAGPARSAAARARIRTAALLRVRGAAARARRPRRPRAPQEVARRADRGRGRGLRRRRPRRGRAAQRRGRRHEQPAARRDGEHRTQRPPKGDDGQQPETAKPADPAEAQAKALDALLKDSNNSRDAVIKAVDATRSCKDLGKSASDLRDAAGQRNGLVSRLDQTAIDKLPGHDDLKAQLTKAWQSSASADSHYASWADQVGGKHGCIKGHARPSRDSVAGDQASGQATDAKKKAADLWSPIAKKYGLTAHDWTQL
ncbi:hypothetical protein GCM10020000_32720 [Streptomyces olivoverticillatus]